MANYTNTVRGKKMGEMVRCPVKGCRHQGEIITVNHFRTVHGFTGATRAEAIKQYGAPIAVVVDPLKLRGNRQLNDTRSSTIYS